MNVHNKDDKCCCDWKQQIKIMWARIQSTVTALKVNGNMNYPDGDGIITVNTDDFINLDDTIKNSNNPVKNKAIKDAFDEVNEDIADLTETTADAIVSAQISADASTVTITHERLGSASDSDPLPVASSSQAGVINASDYSAFLTMQGDIEDLKEVIVTYAVTLPSDTPTQAQITTAFQTAWPDKELIAGVKVADYDRGLFYQYDGDSWVQIATPSTVPIATASTVGGVKSSSVDGEVAVNLSGTMSLNGWDALVSRVQDIDGNGGSIEQLEAEIDSLHDDIGDASSGIIKRLNEAENQIALNESDITELDRDIVRIDGELAGKNKTLGQATLTLTVAGWTNKVQTVTVQGLTASDIVFVSPGPSTASEYASKGIIAVSQAVNSLSFTCEEVPSVPVYVNVVIA